MYIISLYSPISYHMLILSLSPPPLSTRLFRWVQMGSDRLNPVCSWLLIPLMRSLHPSPRRQTSTALVFSQCDSWWARTLRTVSGLCPHCYYITIRAWGSVRGGSKAPVFGGWRKLQYWSCSRWALQCVCSPLVALCIIMPRLRIRSLSACVECTAQW